LVEPVRFRTAARIVRDRERAPIEVEVVVESDANSVAVGVPPISLHLSSEEARWLADALHAACHLLRQIQVDDS
jgi:hypothetical protein